MALKNYLITGASGAGKTAVCQELVSLGHRAIDADEVFAYYVDPDTKLPTSSESPQNWYWDPDQAERILADESDGVLFVCGGAMNQDAFLRWFATGFVLWADDDTLTRRVLERGMHQDHLTLELEWNARAATYAAERNLTVIDATAPLKAVVDAILEKVAL